MVWLILLGHRPHSIVQGARCCYPKQKDKTHQTCQLPGKFFGNSHFLDWLLTNWCLLLENKYLKCDRTQSWIWTQSLVSVRYQISKYCRKNLVSVCNFIFLKRIISYGFQSLEWSQTKDVGTLQCSVEMKFWNMQLELKKCVNLYFQFHQKYLGRISDLNLL